MAKNVQILIFEDKGSFRKRLLNICAEIGDIYVADHIESALDLLKQHSFQLLLLDWNLIQPDFSAFWLTIDNFQPSACRIALFSAPQLSDVVSAMKSGMNDVFWTAQDSTVLRQKIKDSLSWERPSTIAHSHVSQWAESLTDKALTQKTSLFRARREFSKTFLYQILSLQKMQRSKLANIMSVNPRTLYRHLSG